MKDMGKEKKVQLWHVVLGLVIVLCGIGIALPHFFRAKMSGPATPGASTIRTINTAEVTYATNYEKIGYAPNLIVLGPVNTSDCGPEHACLLDNVVSCPEGIGQGWCVKTGYRYNIQTSSSEPPYKDYWVTATPIEADPSLKNYCSAEDAVIRIESAAPLKRPYTRAECLALPPLSNDYPP